ncbi:class F sortase [Streptomyces sp. NPDC002643]
MAPRRRAPRPWYRTRAYRLTRTIVVTVVLVVGAVHVDWGRGAERLDVAGARGAGASRAPEPLYFTPPPATPSPTAPTPTGASPSAEAGQAGQAGAAGTAAESAGPASGSAGGSAAPASGSAGPGNGSAAPANKATTPANGSAPAGGGSTPPGEPSATARKPGAPAQRPDAPARKSAAPDRPATLPPSPPKTLVIPYLGIKAPVMGLRLDDKGRLPAPPDDKPKLVGWYSAGPAPGGPGTAVVVGHRDTRTGPAVFAALEMIKRGRIVEVRRADGRTAVYKVDAVRTYEKSRFPDEKVYGTRDRPELRLITCGGAYDRRKGYSSNVVVFAHLTGSKGPGTGGR